MARRVAAAMILVAVLLGGYLRAAPIATRPLWYDEAFTWYVAAPGNYGAWIHWQSREPNHPPGSFVAAALSMKLFGSRAEWAVRLPSVVSGVLLIPAMAVLGTLSAGPLAGGIAALLTAVAPNMVDQGQQARMFSMLALLEVLALCYAVYLLERPSRMADQDGELPRWAMVGTLVGMMLWMNHLALAVAAGIFLAVGVCALFDASERGLGRALGDAVFRVGAMATVTAILVLPGLPVLLRMVLGAPTGGEAPSAPALMEIAGGVAENIVLLAGSPAAAIIVYALAFAGFEVVRKRHWRTATLLGAVAFFAFVIVFPLRARHPLLVPRYLIALEPVIWVCVAAAVAHVFKSGQRSVALVVAGAMGFVFVALTRASLATDHWGTFLRDLVPMATIRVAKELRPGDVVIFHPEFNRIVGYYYGLPRKPPLQEALFRDPSVADPATLSSTPRPLRLWMIGGFTHEKVQGLEWLDEQREEIRALASWYGRAEDGVLLASSIAVGDTFIARFDPSEAKLEIVGNSLP